MELRTILITIMTLIIVGLVVLVYYEFAYGGNLYSGSRVVPYKTSVKMIDTLHSGRDYMQIDTPLPPSSKRAREPAQSF